MTRTRLHKRSVIGGPVVLLALAVLFLLSCNPKTLDQVGMSISDTLEPTLSSSLARSVLETAPIVDDPAAKAYLDSLTNAIGRNTARPDVQYDTYIVDADDINAFTVGGGYLFYNKGFIARCRNESQMAGVIGHEIGHNVGRHITKGLVARLGVAIVSQIARGENPNQAREITAGLLGMGGSLFALKLSRGNEAYSDRIGVESTVASGISPDGLPEFFQVLRDHYGDSPAGIEQYFAEHPPLVSRIDETQKTIAAQGLTPSVKSGLRNDSGRFRWLRKRMSELNRYVGADTFVVEARSHRPYGLKIDFKDAADIRLVVDLDVSGAGASGTRMVVTDSTGVAMLEQGKSIPNPVYNQAATAGTKEVRVANKRNYYLVFDNTAVSGNSKQIIAKVVIRYRAI